MLETIGLEAIITWVGTAGVIFGSGKVLLNGTKEAIHQTRDDVSAIRAAQVATDIKVGVLDERTLNISDLVSKLESRIE